MEIRSRVPLQFIAGDWFFIFVRRVCEVSSTRKQRLSVARGSRSILKHRTKGSVCSTVRSSDWGWQIASVASSPAKETRYDPFMMLSMLFWSIFLGFPYCRSCAHGVTLCFCLLYWVLCTWGMWCMGADCGLTILLEYSYGFLLEFGVYVWLALSCFLYMII